MGRMTRTQISLSRSQYDFLKAEAVSTGVSLSQIIRGLVDEKMRGDATADDAIMALAGLIHDGAIRGADHDRILAEALEHELGLDPNRAETA